jgi:hypothetical protein
MRVTALSETRHHDTARSSGSSTRLKIAEKRPGRCGSFSRIQGMLSWRCLAETCGVVSAIEIQKRHANVSNGSRIEQ